MENRLFDIAGVILGVVEDGLNAETITLPDRRYVANGEVADDCDQLTVSVPRVFTGLPAQEQFAAYRSGTATLSGDFRIRLIRCVPSMDDDGNAPAGSDIEASAEDVLLDGWALTKILREAHADGGVIPKCDDISFGPLIGVGPEGGVAGWQIDVQVQLTQPTVSGS